MNVKLTRQSCGHFERANLKKITGLSHSNVKYLIIKVLTTLLFMILAQRLTLKRRWKFLIRYALGFLSAHRCVLCVLNMLSRVKWDSSVNKISLAKPGCSFSGFIIAGSIYIYIYINAAPSWNDTCEICYRATRSVRCFSKSRYRDWPYVCSFPARC